MAFRPRTAAVIATWGAASLGALLAAVRLLGLEDGYPLQALIAFTPLGVPAIALVVVAASLLRSWAAAALAVAALAALLVAIAPRAVGDGHDPPGASGPELRVMSSNMKLGSADAESLVALVRDLQTDVLSVQEITRELRTKLSAAGLDNLLPHAIEEIGTGSLGSAIFAREPLRELPKLEPPDYGFPMPNALLAMPGAEPVEVASIHVNPPTGPVAVARWEEGLDALPSGSSSERPLILLGDFNATLDHQELRQLIDRGYIDAADATGAGLSATWPAARRFIPPFAAIDHVLADERIGVEGFATHRIGGSDHKAVSATLRLPSG